MHMSCQLKRPLAGLVLAAVLGLLVSNPAQAQWKWRDSRGQVHISDLPPPRDVPDKDVMQRPEAVARRAVASAAPASAPTPALAASAAAPLKAPVDPELEERRRRTEQEQAARAKADEKKAAAARADNCARAREQLATLDSGMRIARVKADGEREILDDNARAAEAKRARDVMAAECR